MRQNPKPLWRLPIGARRRWPSLLVVFASLLLSNNSFCHFVLGQEDIVITHRKNSAETIKRRGKIKEWKGFAITLSNDVSETKIENDEIVEVQTSWPPDYLAGLESLESGDLTAAIEQLRAALNSERRNWAQRIIRADLVRACQATDNHLAAVEQFLAITNADPQTRFFHLCPLPWLPTTVALDQPAQVWMKSSDPVQQLIGASWSLTSTTREPAIKVLEELSRDMDANIKSLAIAQLWRSRQRNLNARQLKVWKNLIAEMPRPVRAGPWFVLAEAQARADQTDEAIINLLRIPILYPEQIGLSAAALSRAGHLLHNTGRTSEAQKVWDELRQQHPDSAWAQQAPAADAAAGWQR